MSEFSTDSCWFFIGSSNFCALFLPLTISFLSHDVFMGNIWGAGGRRLEDGETAANGGYLMPSDFVNAVQMTQTDHLPDAFDPTPIENNIGVYYTDWVYGGVSLAVVEDRKWKSGPGEFGDMLDPPGADLLGARQEYFLNEWANRTESDELRIVMSATIFSRPSTHVGKDLVESRLDKDSNGWPKSGRDRALRPLMNNPNTIMLHGDQHMGILIQHGIDEFADGPIAFMVPGTATGYPRAWWPEGPNASADTWVGNFSDGFGNKFTVFAASNPDKGSNRLKTYAGDLESTAHKKGSGYGVLTYNRHESSVRFDMWRFKFDALDVDPDGSDQFVGFPKLLTLNKADAPINRHRALEVKIEAWLNWDSVSGDSISYYQREKSLHDLKSAVAALLKERESKID
jgi:alkaline phosphatase D